MDEVLDDPRPRELLQVPAGLAQCNAVAFDLADAEPLADQFVQPYTANCQLPSCPARWQPNVVDNLLLNECESTSRRGAGRFEMAIALQAFARDGRDRLDRP
jgi:hypothetical protein